MRKYYFFSFIILLSLVGCQRGCTTTHTLERESKTMTINGEKVVVTARLLDYRNSKAVNRRNVFKRKVTHTYGICFDFTSKLYRHKAYYSEGIDDPDNVDLVAQLKRAKVKISKNKQKLALGIDNEVSVMMYLYNGRPLEGMSMMQGLNSSQLWSNLDLDALPDPEELMAKAVTESCDHIMFDKEVVSMYLDDLPGHDTLHTNLIQQWPDCSFAEDYYTAQRVIKYRKNPSWMKRAEDQAYKSIVEAPHRHRSEEYDQFIRALKSVKIDNASDSILVANWGRTTSSETTNRIIDRLKSKKKPLSKHLHDQVIADAQKEFSQFMRSGESNYKREATVCMRILLATNQTEQIDQFLEESMQTKTRHYDVFDMLECLLDNFNELSLDQQDYIKSHLDHLVDKIPPYARDVLTRRLDGIAPCDQLKEWVNKYPDDIEQRDLPEGC